MKKNRYGGKSTTGSLRCTRREKKRSQETSGYMSEFTLITLLILFTLLKTCWELARQPWPLPFRAGHGNALSRCTAAGSAGSAHAAPSPEPVEPCWTWWSGWSGWTGPTWCCGSATTPAWGGFGRCNAAGSSWRRTRPCWWSTGASGPVRRSAARWGPQSGSAPQNPWPGWTRWATAARRADLSQQTRQFHRKTDCVRPLWPVPAIIGQVFTIYKTVQPITKKMIGDWLDPGT